MSILPASASVALRTPLSEAPRAVTVLAAFPRAAYLAFDAPAAAGVPTSDATVVALVTSDGVAHPNALVLAAPAAHRPLRALYRGARLVIGDRAVTAASLGLQVRVTRWWDPRPSVRPLDPHTLDAHLDRAAHRAGPADRRLTEPLARVADALVRGDRVTAVSEGRSLLGIGPGLTPAGDDVLAGLVAGVAVLAASGGPPCSALAEVTAAVGAELATAAVDRTTSVSAALLRHAARGEVARPAAVWLHAAAGVGDLDAATDALLQVGGTSGHDLLTGLLTAGALVCATAAASVPQPLIGRSS